MENLDELMNQSKAKPSQNKTYADKGESIKEKRDRCGAMIDEMYTEILKTPDRLMAYLDVQSRLSAYSVGNQLLILKQKPNATKLKTFDAWKKEEVNVKKGAKGMMILEPRPYKTKDGKTGTSFDPKTVFDISDTTAEVAEAKVSHDGAMLVRALVHDSPADISTLKEYPSDREDGAYYDVAENHIYARQKMSYAEILTSVSQALAHAELAAKKENYRVADHAFQARCVAYVIAKKYGVPTDLVQIHSIPAHFADYDKKQIKEDFGDIHACVRAISGRMDDALGLKKEKQKDSPSKEDSR